MKKDKLISLLQGIKGNPQIYLWNGFVEDWVDIDANFVECNFVRETFTHKLALIRNECMQEKGVFELTQEDENNCVRIATAAYNSGGYDIPNNFVDPSRFSCWYGDKVKPVVLINSKSKNKTTFDRAGGIIY